MLHYTVRMRSLIMAGMLFLSTPAAVADTFLRGRVVDALDERPLEGAVVRVADRETTTDPAGEYRLRVFLDAEKVLDIRFTVE